MKKQSASAHGKRALFFCFFSILTYLLTTSRPSDQTETMLWRWVM